MPWMLKYSLPTGVHLLAAKRPHSKGTHGEAAGCPSSLYVAVSPSVQRQKMWSLAQDSIAVGKTSPLAAEPKVIYSRVGVAPLTAWNSGSSAVKCPRALGIPFSTTPVLICPLTTGPCVLRGIVILCPFFRLAFLRTVYSWP